MGMKVNGKMEYQMGKEPEHGQMEKNVFVILKKGMRTEKGLIIIRMEESIQANLRKEKSMDREPISGLMGQNILESGKMIKGTEREY